MSETSGMMNLNLNDVVKGLISAVMAAVGLSVLTVLNGVFQAPDFSVFAVDWAEVGVQIINVSVNAAFAAFVGYVGKNFFTDREGKVFGKIG